MKFPFRLSIACLVLWPLVASATVVTTATDEDNGSFEGGTGVSLREAVKYSPSGDTITFAPALSGQTIRLTLGQIVIDRSLAIDGSALPTKITLSGDKTGNGKTSDDTGILKITTGTVLLDSLILTRANATWPTTNGGAIHVDSATTQLTIRNTTLADNESTTHGGAVYFLGAPDNPSSFLDLQNCTLSGNETGHDGGGIWVTGTLRVENTVFSSNSAYQGSAIYHIAGSSSIGASTFTGNAAWGSGGGIRNGGIMDIATSTFTGNTSASSGGGIHNVGSMSVRGCTFGGNSVSGSGQGGGAICNINGTLAIENSTLTANTRAAIVSSGAVSVLHSTITGNSGSTAGGIHHITGPLSVNRSIVAGNSTVNIASPGFTGSWNLTSGSPLLASLGNHGGHTQTMPPLPGSPAINAGGSVTLLTDQRGFPRRPAADIGAVEYHTAATLAESWNRDTDGDGSPFGAEQALGTDPAVADSNNIRNLTAPFINTSGHAVLSFGFGSAVPGTRWILKRSANLASDNFQEIYRYTGSSQTMAQGISSKITGSAFIITDSNPPSGQAFYRFEAVLQP